MTLCWKEAISLVAIKVFLVESTVNSYIVIEYLIFFLNQNVVKPGKMFQINFLFLLHIHAWMLDACAVFVVKCDGVIKGMSLVTILKTLRIRKRRKPDQLLD